MNNKLEFKKVTENKKLVAESTYKCIENIFSEEEKNDILVAEINPEYIDGIKLCEYYGIDTKIGANCLICECKRGENKKMLLY